MPSLTPDERSIAHAAAQLTAAAQTIEVLALTMDAALMTTLREALGAERGLRHAISADQAVEQIMSGRVGVIVIDAPAVGDELAGFCDRLRTQFPDTILLVAGNAEVQTQLIKQITAGDVYRFLHVPVSPPRARQFLEAALRRHLEGRTFTPADVVATEGKSRKGLYVGVGILLALCLAIAMYFVFSAEPGRRPGKATAAPVSQPIAEPARDLSEEPLRQASSAPIVTPDAASEDLSPTSPPDAQSEAVVAPPAAPQAQSPPPVAPVKASPPPVAVASAPSPRPGSEASQLLRQADEALSAGRLVTPEKTNAADLYARVLALEPENRAAEEGVDRVADHLLLQAESALLDSRIDEAAAELDAARRLRPQNARLAFVSAQLAKERERKLAAQAREIAAGGNHARARAMLDRAMQGQKPPSPVLLQARREIDQLRVGDNVENLLKLANDRLQHDQLVEPANDSALAYIDAALAADANNVSAQQARRALADALVGRARQAIAHGEAGAAQDWLDHARALDADRTQLRVAQGEMAALTQALARNDEMARLASLVKQRMTDRLLDTPERDSALYYWQTLRAMDASHPSLVPSAQALGAALVEQGKEALARNGFDDATRALQEAKSIGHASVDLSALERALAAQREQAAFLANVIPASRLESTKIVQPRYPPLAERDGVEGWVDLEFTVAADGSVKDIKVTGAQPAGVFEDVALRAVTQWKYRPFVRDGAPVPQRARLKLKFEVPD
jgi:protein TonB